MLTLAFTRQEGPFGWGVCNKNLIKELSGREGVQLLPPDNVRPKIPGKVLHTISNILFQPSFEVSGDYNAGYCFFELIPAELSIRNAMSFDHIFCGSTYNVKILEQFDVFHTSLLIQGVDHDIFSRAPARQENGKFNIFSGGKFEFRKGQDLVLAAFKALMDKYPDLHLTTVWENLWPESAATMSASTHIKLNLWGNSWKERMATLCVLNGIPPERVTHHEICSQSDVARIMADTDLGVFPNRCEGGTNLMLMEYMARQRPVIASYNSGHMDVANAGNSRLLTQQDHITLKPYPGMNLTACWWEPQLDELIDAIEWAHEHRERLGAYAKSAADTMERWTWKHMADTVMEHFDNPKLDDPLHLPQRYVFGSLLNRLGYTGEGAEVGVFWGGLSKFIYSRWMGKMLYLVDRWQHIEGYNDITNSPQDAQEERYQTVMSEFADKSDVRIMRMDSIEASKKFADGQLDWVYIDADHTLEAIRADLKAWVPKVRVGGLVAGHDYFDGPSEYATFGVRTAVNELVARCGYKLRLSDDTRNGMRTWYFLKDK
jgi:glycosyltransferase involved in cell wall biosynthesis